MRSIIGEDNIAVGISPIVDVLAKETCKPALMANNNNNTQLSTSITLHQSNTAPKTIVNVCNIVDTQAHHRRREQ